MGQTIKISIFYLFFYDRPSGRRPFCGRVRGGCSPPGGTFQWCTVNGVCLHQTGRTFLHMAGHSSLMRPSIASAPVVVALPRLKPVSQVSQSFLCKICGFPNFCCQLPFKILCFPNACYQLLFKTLGFPILCCHLSFKSFGFPNFCLQLPFKNLGVPNLSFWNPGFPKVFLIEP